MITVYKKHGSRYKELSSAEILTVAIHTLRTLGLDRQAFLMEVAVFDGMEKRGHGANHEA